MTISWWSRTKNLEYNIPDLKHLLKRFSQSVFTDVSAVIHSYFISSGGLVDSGALCPSSSYGSKEFLVVIHIFKYISFTLDTFSDICGES